MNAIITLIFPDFSCLQLLSEGRGCGWNFPRRHRLHTVPEVHSEVLSHSAHKRSSAFWRLLCKCCSHRVADFVCENNAVSDIYVACSRSSEQLINHRNEASHWSLYQTCSASPRSADSISSDEEEMRTMGSSGSESSTPDKMATAASIFTEQSNLVSKCKRFEQKYRMALEQKVACLLVCTCVCGERVAFLFAKFTL